MTEFKHNNHSYKFNIRADKYGTYIAHFACSKCGDCSTIIHADTKLTQAQCEKYVIAKENADKIIGFKVGKLDKCSK